MYNTHIHKNHKDLSTPLLQRFLKYVTQDTQSNAEQADKGIMPSTEKQRDFNQFLYDELRTLGLSDIILTKDNYLCGRLPATQGYEQVPAVALLAHIDTAEDVSGANVRPLLHEDYCGKDFQLPSGIIIPYDDYLKNAQGDTIITSSGDTLLGADDKAGLAAIITTLEYFLQHPEIPHGTIECMFSPDEETGHGMDKVPLDWFTAKQAYTVDGGDIGEIESECFNAWKSEITFIGRAKHTGYAKGFLVNAITMASNFITALPPLENPENTEGYEGFYAPMKIEGHIEEAKITLFLRDFSLEGIKERIKTIDTIAKNIELQFIGGKVQVVHTQQYLNMKDKIALNPLVMENLIKAVKAAGIQPVFKPIRGGTDGSRLTEMGLPCPNIFTGGHNFHSRTEWASLSQMTYSVLTLIELIKIWSQT